MKWIIAPLDYPLMEIEANSESEARTIARKEIGRIRLPKGTLIFKKN